MKKYIVKYTTDNYTTEIDTIEAADNYTAEDYIRDCAANADVEWNEMLAEGTVTLEEIVTLRIWKVYAQCVNSVKPVIDVTNDADAVIEAGINENINYRISDGSIDFPEDDDDALDSALSAAYEAFMNRWNHNGYLDCGDYCLVRSVDRPDRPNICGFEIMPV